MIRRNSTFAAARDSWEDDDVNPMDGVSNLSDVMLVFAVALMLAIIAHWNVSLNASEINSSNLVEVDDTSEIVKSVTQGSSSFVESGTVYTDINTGKTYVLLPEDSEAASSLEGGASASTSATSASTGASE